MSCFIGVDVSTKTGLARLNPGHAPVLKQVVCKRKIDVSNYPWSLIDAAQENADLILHEVQALAYGQEDVEVAIEDTNPGRNRAVQKFLEWTHLFLAKGLKARNIRATYLDSSKWRQAIGLKMTAADKAANALLKKSKASAKAAGIKGKIGTKHLAVRWANAKFGLELKQKDNDLADALGLAEAKFILDGGE